MWCCQKKPYIFVSHIPAGCRAVSSTSCLSRMRPRYFCKYCSKIHELNQRSAGISVASSAQLSKLAFRAASCVSDGRGDDSSCCEPVSSGAWWPCWLNNTSKKHHGTEVKRLKLLVRGSLQSLGWKTGYNFTVWLREPVLRWGKTRPLLSLWLA